MLAVNSPLPDLDELVRDVSPARRADAVRKLGVLFADGAQNFNSQHVALFDGVLKGLLLQADSDVRADLANCLAPIVNAPPSVVRELVHDDVIAVSGPLLIASPLVDEPTLIEIARIKGQPHLLAISQRRALSQ